MSDDYVVFSHGLDGSPWGAKIVALAGVARRRGFEVDSIDYQDTSDPEVRTGRLIAAGRKLPPRLVLVGSSLGGHVAAAAARELGARGLFLMAPAFYMPGYEQHTPEPLPGCAVTLVHGWRDDIVPAANSLRYAARHRATLHVLDGDHRLQGNIPQLEFLFDHFLATLPA